MGLPSMSEGDGDRVLGRAAELERQMARKAALDVARLVERGAEAGVDEAFVRLALVERQLRLPTSSGGHGLAAWAAGPRAVRGLRRVPVPAGTAQSRLMLWLEARTRLVIDEHLHDGSSWRHRNRFTRHWHRDADDHLFERIDRLGVGVAAVGKEDCFVLITADLRWSRAVRLLLSVLLGLVVGWVADDLLGVPLLATLAIVPLVAWLAARTQHRAARQVMQDVDVMIASLPDDVPPPGSRRSILNRVARTLHGRTM